MAHTCPWWLGSLLASPLRKLRHKPEEILKYYVDYDMKAIDVGPGMGFFTIPMARMVGAYGHVYAIDVQEKMIEGLKKRATKAGVLKKIETRICSHTSLEIDDLEGKIDFILAFYVVHELSDIHSFFKETHDALKVSGKLMVAEPKGHVKKQQFEDMISVAKQQGYEVVGNPKIKKSHTAVFAKK